MEEIFNSLTFYSTIISNDLISVSNKIYQKRLLYLFDIELKKISSETIKKDLKKKFNEFLSIMYDILNGQEHVKICPDPSVYLIGNYGTNYSIHFEIFPSSENADDSLECAMTIFHNKENIANEFGLINEIANSLKAFIQKTTINDENHIPKTAPRVSARSLNSISDQKSNVSKSPSTKAWIPAL
ncbi:hypothetical protein [Leptospira alstonii]|uniref:hypothetical protein n=1 Tax=Leptospira alstonii TaxID=28452 RepID=UPI000562C42B|nr:hypothetical protein [Leptospira alstonii]